MYVDRWSMPDGYTLVDNESDREYTTWVSLADCTIPFVYLLNRESNYVKFYQKELAEARERISELEKKVYDMDYLMKRFEFLYEESVEEMCDKYDD